MEIANFKQKTIQIRVTYYTRKEEKKFKSYETAAAIQRVVEEGIEVPIAEFLTYFMFSSKRRNKRELADYDALSTQINTAIHMMAHYISFNGSSIHWDLSTEKLPTEVTQRIGEAAALCVMNRIHGLIEADWARIKESQGPNAPKVFDYDHMSADNKHFIEVEAKGSCLNELTTKKSGAVTTHKSDIVKKKKEQEDKEVGEGVTCLRYGSIAEISPEESAPLTVLLVDPPKFELEFKPINFRLLNRLRFISEWITLISPTSQFAQAVSGRVNALEALKDPFELDGKELRRPNGEMYELERTFDFYFKQHSPFFASKSRVTDGPVGGVLFPLKGRSALFFAGIREPLLQIAANQDFAEVLTYEKDIEVASVEKTVQCSLNSTQMKQFDLPERIQEDIHQKGSYFIFSLKGQLHYSKAGLVFGVLPFPE